MTPETDAASNPLCSRTTNDYQHLSVCTTSSGLKVVDEGREHRCGCQPTDNRWKTRERAGHDVAAALDLCHRCDRSRVRTGSRWTWYACEQCRHVDNRIASALAVGPIPAKKDLPLGRHSLMSPTKQRADGAHQDTETTRFTEALMEMHQLWSRLSVGKQEDAQRLGYVSGLNDLASVPLETWLKANATSPRASMDTWCRFVDERLTDIPELDDLPRARNQHMDRSSA